MEWRTIPGFEDYEVTLSGHVRRRDTRYRVSRVGSRYRLRANGQLHKMLPAEIVALAFPGPEIVERLRARVTELEKALRQVREGNKAATAPVASPKRPQPSAPPAKPQAAVRKERNAEPRVKADTGKSLRASRPCPPPKKAACRLAAETPRRCEAACVDSAGASYFAGVSLADGGAPRGDGLGLGRNRLGR